PTVRIVEDGITPLAGGRAEGAAQVGDHDAVIVEAGVQARPRIVQVVARQTDVVGAVRRIRGGRPDDELPTVRLEGDVVYPAEAVGGAERGHAVARAIAVEVLSEGRIQ